MGCELEAEKRTKIQDDSRSVATKFSSGIGHSLVQYLGVVNKSSFLSKAL